MILVAIIIPAVFPSGWLAAEFVERGWSRKRLLRLIGDYLRASMQQGDGSRVRRVRGTPQGGPLSPLLANIYLNPLDQELERRGLSFVRYADDIAIFDQRIGGNGAVYLIVVLVQVDMRGLGRLDGLHCFYKRAGMFFTGAGK